MIENRIACFISPHGFGHATRAVAVMSALTALVPVSRFEIFTKVPQWIFDESLSGIFNYHSLVTDVGLAQKTSLREDIPKTVEYLENFLPFDTFQISQLAALLTKKRCKLIICDIAPMGIAVGKRAAIPSVLVENFTWDWIYEEYTNHTAQMITYSTYLRELFKSADYHVQTEPVCSYAKADLTTKPVSRTIKMQPDKVRRKLGVPGNAKLVTVTMGGVPEEYSFFDQLAKQKDIYFLIPGGSEYVKINNNVLTLPYHSDLYHPDLINASDVVVGKVGYSTLAEVYHAGVPFGYITRPRFRESDYLASYIKQYIHNVHVTEQEFLSGRWISHLPELLAMPRIQRNEPNGSEQVAEFISHLLRKMK
ncbi:MAG: hypothetical protein ACMUIP_09115 [bacterium]